MKSWYNGNVIHNTFPERLKGLSLREVETVIGASHPAREAPLFLIEYDDLEVNIKDEGLVVIRKVEVAHYVLWRLLMFL